MTNKKDTTGKNATKSATKNTTKNTISKDSKEKTTKEKTTKAKVIKTTMHPIRKCKRCGTEKVKGKCTKCGAPTKCNSKFIKAVEKVVNKDINAIILTDEELLMLINDELEIRDRVALSTFKKWKAGEIKEDYNYKKFLYLYSKALTRQKQNLFRELGDTSQQQWQRWAWIIERKFDDWNIRHKQDISGTLATYEEVKKQKEKYKKKD